MTYKDDLYDFQRMLDNTLPGFKSRLAFDNKKTVYDIEQLSIMHIADEPNFVDVLFKLIADEKIHRLRMHIDILYGGDKKSEFDKPRRPDQTEYSLCDELS